VPVAAEAARLINEHTGLEVAEVVPVKRIPKTTSGKIQRHLLEQEYLDGAFTAELSELMRLRGAAAVSPAGGADALQTQLLRICNTVLSTRPIGAGDNLFEIGVSSLKLIEIHELIDHEFPGQIDLTEIFDHPTVADMARFLSAKVGS
jgi:aryl carrier-like protein